MSVYLIMVTKKITAAKKKTITLAEKAEIERKKILKETRENAIRCLKNNGDCVLLVESEDYLIFSKYIVLDVRITNNNSIFQPYEAHHEKRYSIVLIMEFPPTLTTYIQDHYRDQVCVDLIQRGAEVIRVTEFTNVNKRLEEMR